MPTERFYRLTETKKMTIRNAAIKEFVRVPFEKASINRMIQDAGISRGSFYTYFEDKRDVLTFIFQDMKEKAQARCVESIERTHGDFWVMMEDLMEFTITCCESDDILQLSKNTRAFHHDKGMLMDSLCKKDGHWEDSHMNKWLYDHIDKTHLQISDSGELLMLFDMAMTNLMASATQYYEKTYQPEDLKRTFRKKMKILRYGINKSSTG